MAIGAFPIDRRGLSHAAAAAEYMFASCAWSARRWRVHPQPFHPPPAATAPRAPVRARFYRSAFLATARFNDLVYGPRPIAKFQQSPVRWWLRAPVHIYLTSILPRVAACAASESSAGLARGVSRVPRARASAHATCLASPPFFPSLCTPIPLTELTRLKASRWHYTRRNCTRAGTCVPNATVKESTRHTSGRCSCTPLCFIGSIARCSFFISCVDL